MNRLRITKQSPTSSLNNLKTSSYANCKHFNYKLRKQIKFQLPIHPFHPVGRLHIYQDYLYVSSKR